MREKLIMWLFDNTQKIYLKYKNRESWNISTEDLLLYRKNSLGYNLGVFLKRNGFKLMPKVERHDVFHLITGIGTKIKDEIALQYLCYGNGKRGSYLYMAILTGIVLFPEYLMYYIKSYRLGKNSNMFHHFNFKKLLNEDLKELRMMIFSKQQLEQLHEISI